MSAENTQPDRALIANMTVPSDTPPAHTLPNPTGTGGGGLDVNARVRVGDKEMTVAELIASQASASTAAQELAALKEYQRHSDIVLRGDAPKEQQIASHRFLMSKQGYSPEQIEAHIQQAFGSTESTKGAEEPNEDEVSRLRAELAKDRSERMNAEFTKGVEEQIASHEGLVLLFKAAERLGSDIKAVKATAVKEITKSTRDNLRRKYAETGQPVTSQTLNAAIREAAQEHAEVLRSYIGDPSRLGKSSETIADSFADNEDIPEVKQPVYTPTVGRAKHEDNVTKWLTASIRRDAKEMARAGSSLA